MKRILILMLLVLAACSADTQPQNIDTEPQPDIQDTQFHGLDISFAEGQPPAQVSSGQQFNILVNLDNQGDADSRAEVTLQGFNPEKAEFENDIEQTKFVPAGNKASVLLGAVNLGPDTPSQIVLRAEVCYSYSTEATFVCDPECRISNAAAPVLVEDVFISETEDGFTQVTFTPANQDNGRVYSGDCDNLSAQNRYNLSIREGHCPKMGSLDRQNTCTVQEEFDGTLSGTLELEYMYKDHAQTEVEFT